MEAIDDKPGAYYVSASNGKKTEMLFGPFMNNHEAALVAVEKVRKVACDIDPRAHWYSFGTARKYGADTYPLGTLNNLDALK